MNFGHLWHDDSSHLSYPSTFASSSMFVMGILWFNRNLELAQSEAGLIFKLIEITTVRQHLNHQISQLD